MIDDQNQLVGDKPIHQIRIAVEILRAYIEPQLDNLTDVEEGFLQDVTNAEQEYLQNVYQEILENLGTSTDEIRLARTSGSTDGEDIAQTRHSLADRLGIEIEQVDNLFLQPNELTEEILEQLFGLLPTTTNSLNDSQTQSAQLLKWRVDYLRKHWKNQDNLGFSDTNESLPIIDPDQIPRECILNFDENNTISMVDSDFIDVNLWKVPHEIWNSRRKELNEIQIEIHTTVEDVLKSQPTEIAAYDTIIDEYLKPIKSNSNPINLETELELRTKGELNSQYEEIEQLPSLDLSTLRHLVRLRELAESGTSTDLDWTDLQAILLQVDKRECFTKWQKEEQEKGLFLSPDFFTLSNKEPIQPAHSWQMTRQTQISWEKTLRARTEQVQTAIQSLQTTVDTAESVALIGFRDALIETFNDSQMADKLAHRLLFDFKNKDERKTTRIEQAIETVQNLFFALRMGRINDGDKSPLDDNPLGKMDSDLKQERALN